MEDNPLEGRSLRVVVSVNGTPFRIPCSHPSFTVGELCQDVARRYERHSKVEVDSCSVAELRAPDGSVLDEGDAIRDLVLPPRKPIRAVTDRTH